MVAITEDIIGVSQLLGERTRAPKSTPMITGMSPAWIDEYVIIMKTRAAVLPDDASCL